MSDTRFFLPPDDAAQAPVGKRTGVLLASTYALVREGLKTLIDAEPGLRVCAQAGDAADALQRLQDASCGVLLLDQEMAGVGTPALIAQVRRRKPRLPLLMLMPDVPSATIYAVLQAGASGCVSKRGDTATLLQALRHVVGGGRYLEPSLVNAMVFNPPGQGPAPAPRPAQAQAASPLSAREDQVMRRLVRGERNNDIAAELGLSEKTVAAHKANILRKLGLTRTAELVIYAESISA